MQVSEHLPFVGHRPVRVHLKQGANEQPVAQAVNAEQLIVLFQDPASALNKSLHDALQQSETDLEVSLVIRRFEFRSARFCPAL